MHNKKIYSGLCKTELIVPIFLQDWWLDAACAFDHWDVALVEQGGLIMAALPYMLKRKYGLRLIIMPPLTQTLGPWLRPCECKITTQYSQEKKILNKLIEGLPKFDYFSQNFHSSISNWLPFFWQGFSQTTRYTYVLENISNHQQILSGFQGNIRREIKKALNRFKLKIRWDIHIDTFLDLYDSTFSRQSMSNPHSRRAIKKIDAACVSRNARQIIAAEDSQGCLHAAVYIIWDSSSAYYLMGGSNPKLRNSGANSLCMWEAIKFASKFVPKFDFEGSMIEPIERFFRGFGAKQIPYFRVTYDTKLVKRMKALKNLILPN